MSSGVAEVRRLVEHRGRHPVVSLYLDLDPEEFATPPARASQIRSLIDGANRDLEGRDGLDHDDKASLREDLSRIDDFLSGPEAPFQGSRALAVFCSGRDALFEVVRLSRPVEPRVVIEPQPYIEPMIAAVQQRRWLVALVNRRSGRVLSGSPERLRERERLDGDTHGQHDQGGWSQARYERSVEKEAKDHLREVAEAIEKRWRRERVDRVALGGPNEVVAGLEDMLGAELREHLAPERVHVDLSSATDSEVRSAIEEVVLADERRHELETLERLGEGVGTGHTAVAGISGVVDALNQRRVQTLILSRDFDGSGSRCPACGLLVTDSGGSCPADGGATEPIEHLREAVVETAVAQDAGVLVVTHHPDREPREGIGALLRF